MHKEKRNSISASLASFSSDAEKDFLNTNKKELSSVNNLTSLSVS